MNSNIETALNTAINALGYPVAWPNRKYDGVAPHLQVSFLGSNSELATFGEDRLPFILQIDVRVQDGSGTTDSMPMVEAVIAAFPKNTEFASGGVSARIDQTPWVSVGFNDDQGWYMTPISIPFEVFQ